VIANFVDTLKQDPYEKIKMLSSIILTLAVMGQYPDFQPTEAYILEQDRLNRLILQRETLTPEEKRELKKRKEEIRIEMVTAWRQQKAYQERMLRQQAIWARRYGSQRSYGYDRQSYIQNMATYHFYRTCYPYWYRRW